MRFVLETTRLGLRPWRAEDLPELTGLLTDPVTMAAWPSTPTAEDARAWLTKTAASWQENGFGRCAVIRLSDGEVLGDAGLMPTEVDGASATDLGYIFHHRHHGQGYATEAAQALLSWGIETLGRRDIVVHMAEDNTPSRRVAERLGLTLSGKFQNPRNLNKTHLIFRP